MAFAGLATCLLDSCKSPVVEKTVVEATVEGRVHVLLKDSAKPVTIIEAFPEFDLADLGRASRSQNKYAFSFRADRSVLTGMKTKLEKHSDVLEVTIVK